MAKTRAVLFDLDGVLVEAPEWHRRAFDEALIEFGLPPLSIKDHTEKYNGLSTIKKLEMLNVARELVPKINARKQELTNKLIEENCKPIKRIREVVEWLFKNGFKTGVVTNCSKLTAQKMLRMSGLVGFWHTSITNNDVDGFIKPHPAPYVRGVRETCYFPELAMAIDDSHHGIESARAARISNIWHLEKFSDLTLKNLKARLET